MVSQLIADDRTPTEVVIQVVADELDVDSVDVSPPLLTVVDGDALDEVFASAENASVEFEWAECRVYLTQQSDGRLEAKAAPAAEMATE
jgi:hypothetical protein